MRGYFSLFVSFVALLIRSSNASATIPELVLNTRSNGRKLLQYTAENHTTSPITFQPSCLFQGPFPYVVSIRGQDGKHRCGGTLITPTAVLTSAACVDTTSGLNNATPRPLLFIGGFRTNEPIETRQTEDVFVPVAWNGNPSLGSDLALLTFSEATCVNPIPYIGNNQAQHTRIDNMVGGHFFLVGNGREGEGDAPFNEVKTIANMTELPPILCNYALNGTLNIRERCFINPVCDCASACEGDEGAPIVQVQNFQNFTDRLIAVTSRSKGPCASPNSTAIATEVEDYKSWLRNLIPIY